MKSTKKSLLLSTLSLIMCVAMLLGTTYAWFTDSVTSGKNKIVAGNLDVELESAAKGTVGEETGLFDGVSKWEPGVAVYDTLTVKNIGNLALKYQLNLIFDNETKVDGHGLSEVLKVGTFDGTVVAGATREAVLAQVSSWQALATFTKSGNLAANTDDTPVTYVIYWQPGDNDNLYNMNNDNKGKELSIDFGVELVATQDTVEADSFDKFYDKNAPWLGGSDAEGLAANTDATEKTVKIENAEQLAAFAASVNAGQSYKGYTVTLENNIDLNNVAWTPIGTNTNVFEGTFDGNGKTISNLSVTGTSKVGFFGRFNAVVKNLTIKNATVKGEAQVGVLAGTAYTGTVKDCKITGLIKVDGNYQTGGMAGYGYASIENVDIDAAEGSYVKATYSKANFEGDAVGGLIGYSAEGSMTIKNSDVKGLTVTGTRKVGGVVGQIGGGTNRTVDACTFDGTVIVDGPAEYFTDNSGKIFAGGIVGELTDGKVTISNCTAKGSLTGKENDHTKAIIGGTRTATLTITETNNNGAGMTITCS